MFQGLICIGFLFFFLCFQWWIVGTLASVTGGVWYALESVNASDLKAAPSPLPWSHKSLLVGFDHARSVIIYIPFFLSKNVQ